MTINPKQWQWLAGVASRIPALFEAVEQGDIRAETALGERLVRGKTVRLTLLVEVVDTGRNPLSSHASTNYPNTGMPSERPITQHPRRGRSKRSW